MGNGSPAGAPPALGPTHPPGPGAGGDAARAPSPTPAPARLPTDPPKLDGARDELLEALDLRTRRVNQLLGERDQLERQLVRAEKALQQLSRELGAAKAARGAPAAPPRPWLRALGDQLRTSLGRLWPRRNVRTPGATVASAGAPSGAGPAPLMPLAQDGKQRAVMAVVACGLAPEERAGVLDVVARQGATGDFLPLVLTDDDDFAPLRSRSMLFEYLPPAAVREDFAPALEWDLYLQRRLALIRRKWRPVRVIAFGRAAADLVQLWAESPFEDPALGRLPAAERPASPPPGTTGDGPLPEGAIRQSDHAQAAITKG